MDRGRTELIVPSTTLIKVVFFVFIAMLLLETLHIFILVLTSIVLATALEPFIRPLSRKIPRVFATGTIYLLAITFFFGIAYAFVPVIVEDASRFINRLPDIIVSIQEYLNNNQTLSKIFSSFAVADASLWQNRIAQFVTITGSTLFTTTTVVVSGLFTILLVLLLSFYFAVKENNLTNFIRLVSPKQYREYTADLWSRSREKIGQWMKGQLILGLIIGTLTYLGLTILGIPHAFLFAVLAGMFELVPIFGPFISAVPPTLIAFAELGATSGFLVIGLFVIIQQFENQLIYPLVVTKVVGVPSVLVIIALIVGGSLAGLLGAILAIPVAAFLQELVQDLHNETAKKFIKKEVS